MRQTRPGWTLFVLFLLNSLNFFDRNILGAVVEPLRHEWSLRDAQIGWIGTAFTCSTPWSAFLSAAWPTAPAARASSEAALSCGAP
jgi:hypothetical protein